MAQAADGSLRDALSLLDQLIAFGGGEAGEAEARAMLGTIARDHVVRLVELLAAATAGALLRCAQSLEEFAPDYAQVLDELAALLVRVGLKQAVSDYEGDELYAPELLERLARALSPEDVQLFYQTAIIGRRDLALAPDPRTGFEMTLLRMIAFRPAGEARERAPRRNPQRRARRSLRLPARPPSRKRRPPAARRLRGSAAAASAEPPRGPWARHRRASSSCQRRRAPARQPLRVHRAPGRAWCGSRSIRATSSVRTPAQEDKLAQALSRYFGEPVRLEFQVAGRGRRDSRAGAAACLGSRSSRPRAAPSRPTPVCRACASASAPRCCRTPCVR